MDSATILVIFIVCLLIGIIFYALYVAFGPPSESLRDPFEEHE